MKLLRDDPEGEALLAAVVREPDDDTPRLVAADWLEENGDPDRAALIRLQCRLHPPRAARARGVRCTGLSAVWCPVCGDCACPVREDRMDDAACPLHAPDSPHADYRHWAARERALAALAAVRVVLDGLPVAYTVGHDARRLVHTNKRLHAAGVESARGFERPIALGLSRGFPGRLWVASAIDFEGVARACFLRSPITSVDLWNRPSAGLTAQASDGRLYSADWNLATDTARIPFAPTGSRLPPGLFAEVRAVAAAAPVAGFTVGEAFVEFPTTAAAVAALKLACLRFGRAAAGLPVPPAPLVRA